MPKPRTAQHDAAAFDAARQDSAALDTAHPGATRPASSSHGRIDDRDTRAREVFEAVVGSPDYPCLGARSVLRRHRASVHGYARLASPESAVEILSDLVVFSETTDLSEGFASFVAVFLCDPPADEEQFEALLWRQLQAIRNIDPAPSGPTVSHDPADPDFSFSAGGTAYFVIGLHPAASRPARRSAYPMLVFNPHEQFDRMRVDGTYDRMRDTIRHRDEKTNGCINPMVADHGRISEARQYSGRVVDDDWVAPFDPKPRRRQQVPTRHQSLPPESAPADQSNTIPFRGDRRRAGRVASRNRCPW